MAKIALLTALCLLICIDRIAQSEAAWPWPPEISDPKLRKCFDEHVDYICVRQITASFWSKSVTLEPNCCKVVEEFDEECSFFGTYDDECSFYGKDEDCDTVFAPFKSSSFRLLLTEHCYEFGGWDEFSDY